MAKEMEEKATQELIRLDEAQVEEPGITVETVKNRSTLSRLFNQGVKEYAELVTHAGRVTEWYRTIAKRNVDIRAQILVNGEPDWAARSHTYRETVKRMMDEADVPEATRIAVYNNLRYHVSDVLRERLSEAKLLELGIDPQSKRQRQISRQRGEVAQEKIQALEGRIA